jgi:hypothetical protein
MKLNSFDEVYQTLNEKFINEIIDTESDKLMGVKDTPINFLMLGENDMTRPSQPTTDAKTVFAVEHELRDGPAVTEETLDLPVGNSIPTEIEIRAESSI